MRRTGKYERNAPLSSLASYPNAGGRAAAAAAAAYYPRSSEPRSYRIDDEKPAATFSVLYHAPSTLHYIRIPHTFFIFTLKLIFGSENLFTELSLSFSSFIPIDLS